jgi:hypothetical protein
MRTDICREGDIPFFMGFRQYGQGGRRRRIRGRDEIYSTMEHYGGLFKKQCYYNMLCVIKNQNANYRKKALALGVKEDKFFQLRMNHFV